MPGPGQVAALLAIERATAERLTEVEAAEHRRTALSRETIARCSEGLRAFVTKYLTDVAEAIDTTMQVDSAGLVALFNSGAALKELKLLGMQTARRSVTTNEWDDRARDMVDSLGDWRSSESSSEVAIGEAFSVSVKLAQILLVDGGDARSGKKKIVVYQSGENPDLFVVHEEQEACERRSGSGAAARGQDYSTESTHYPPTTTTKIYKLAEFLKFVEEKILPKLGSSSN